MVPAGGLASSGAPTVSAAPAADEPAAPRTTITYVIHGDTVSIELASECGPAEGPVDAWVRINDYYLAWESLYGHALHELDSR